MSFGALNQFRVIPEMLKSIRTGTERRKPGTRFIKVLTMDVAIFVLLMACASALGLQSPPMH